MGYSAAVTAALKLSRGERFGHLTAIEQARFENHHQLWWFKVLVRDSDRVQSARSENRLYPFLRVFAG
jgi:uncharacterized NAD(P)/FAD-binding protein YdhS